MYGKMTVFELAARVPLIVHAPWLPQSQGRTTQAIVELVDLYPTVAELAGLQPPEDKVPLGGRSFAAVLRASDPERLNSTTVKPYAMSQHARCWKDTHAGKCGTTLLAAGAAVGGDGPHDIHNMCDCHFIESQDIDFMGLSIRVPSWRYVEWFPWDGQQLQVRWDTTLGVELYAHAGDVGDSFDQYENENVASDPANSQVVDTLATTLRVAFRDQ